MSQGLTKRERSFLEAASDAGVQFAYDCHPLGYDADDGIVAAQSLVARRLLVPLPWIDDRGRWYAPRGLSR